MDAARCVGCNSVYVCYCAWPLCAVKRHLLGTIDTHVLSGLAKCHTVVQSDSVLIRPKVMPVSQCT